MEKKKMSSSGALALIVLWCCYVVQQAPEAAAVADGDEFVRCLSASMPSALVYPRARRRSRPYWRRPSGTPSSWPRPRPLRGRCAWPTNASHVQAAVVCGRRHGVRLRVRSGGHDLEGLSYRSARGGAGAGEAFAVLDLALLRAVRVDRAASAAWVDSGATLGELYHAVGTSSSGGLAFPAGLCPTIGVGGHLSGGGLGMLLRKHGVAADHVLDAVLVDARGRLLDRDAMGPDVFWAIRGGGSFGVVLSWRVRLVPVPPTVTAFKVPVSVDQGAVDVLARWQTAAPALPDELFVRVLVQRRVAEFQALYLGTCDALLAAMRRGFPELGVDRTHCREMTWLESVAYVYLGGGATADDLLNRTTSLAAASKAASDFVRRPIPRAAWAEIFGSWLQQARPGAGLMILDPYGGRMGRVAEGATPFPHRGGVLYNIQYMSFWAAAAGDAAAAAGEGWVRELQAFMAPHVSSNPREAYFNYRDLGLGENAVVGNVSSYEAGRLWGEKYFKGNFRRLAMAKAQIDPEDYFRNEQSIPPLMAGESDELVVDEGKWRHQ